MFGNISDSFFCDVQDNGALKDKEFKKALGHYTDAICLFEHNPTYCNNRAMAYLQFAR